MSVSLDREDADAARDEDRAQIILITGLTLALIAGYHRFEERVERLTPYLPAFSAAVLVVMGLGFVLGLF